MASCKNIAKYNFLLKSRLTDCRNVLAGERIDEIALINFSNKSLWQSHIFRHKSWNKNGAFA